MPPPLSMTDPPRRAAEEAVRHRVRRADGAHLRPQPQGELARRVQARLRKVQSLRIRFKKQADQSFDYRIRYTWCKFEEKNAILD